MKWKKKGMIFDAKKFNLNYAKSPQAVVFNDFIRVYFSTCESDNDKLISQVMFVDFDRQFKDILRISDGYIISRGKLGCYDEHGIFPFSPVKIDDQIFAYLGGWTRRVSVSVDSGIGLAVSSDNGMTFKRLGDGPVITSSLFEPYLINDGFVRKYNDIFHMWYIYGTDWLESAEKTGEHSRVYKIGHAVSNNGLIWKKEGKKVIKDKINRNECQALPTVIFYEGMYHMFFCYREATDFRTNIKSMYRIGYAYSTDLEIWHRDDEQVGIDVSSVPDEWDSEMICYPNVFSCSSKIYMLYNGNNFGKYGFGVAELEI